MNPMAIGCIVFALVFGSALVAMYVHRLLPEHHLSADSKDVVRRGIRRSGAIGGPKSLDSGGHPALQ